ncbi:hypothetical protein [Pseudobdellovibrio exovorus]|uniref:Uncharacterized protein n=1 Tax=Pseudobdellovibrio exovorus JSS TaxID=1184267 RepID=M4VBV2_9BACT|nr:hypothetical protein [Pseudobdellovibrio exovorus]AGH95486.1 hypothetical protein A11Q_1270 [Pseudobdellovibrio exovorus JSS]
MRAAALFQLLFLFTFSKIWAQSTIQVPEDCLARDVSPCLIRTSDQVYRTHHRGIAMSIPSQSIVRVSWTENSYDIIVLDGRLQVDIQPSRATVVRFNGLELPDRRYMLRRHYDQLLVLSLQKFVLNVHKVAEGGLSDFVSFKGDFVNKKDFVDFTRHFFDEGHEYRRFLTSYSPKWRAEFKRQNSIQTKVLTRSIASTPEDFDRESEESKKVREQFFYRTFHR